MGFFTPLKEGLSYITVEPIIFLFFWSIPYIDHGNGALLFHKFCLQTYNETICENITSDPLLAAENIIIQSLSSRWIMYSKIAMVIPMLYSTIILGAISDRFHRKLPMVIPAAGLCLGGTWLIILASIPALDVRLLLIATFIFGLTGYFGAALMSTSAYLGVMTHASARTWRISVYESALCFGLVLGTTTSGLIIDHLGIPALYGIIVGINAVAILYTVIRIVETHTVKRESPLWYELCRFTHVKDYCVTVYKPRAQSRRLYIHMIFAAFMVVTCSSQGLYDVLFLYLTKTRGFTNSLFSAFTGAQSVLNTIGNVFIMWILKKKLNLTEPAITFISALCSAVSYSMISATEPLGIWLSLIFVGATGLSGASCRGFLSKLVPSEEQGQVFAFVAMGQCLTALLASVIFNNIYPHTLEHWDGASILLAGLFNIVAMVLAMVVLIHRRANNYDDDALGLMTEESSVNLSQAMSSADTESKQGSITDTGSSVNSSLNGDYQKEALTDDTIYEKKSYGSAT